MIQARSKLPSARVLAGTLLVALLATGCAAHRAYRQGNAEARKGNWDAAVARLTKAVAHSPDNVRYRMALDDARSMAARQHAETGRNLLASGDLDHALEEFEIAAKFDSVNTGIAAALEDARARIRRREDEKREAAERETARARTRAGRFPLPELSPRSQKPIALKFNDASLKYVIETLGKLGGVNILFDPDFKDKQVNANSAGVTFQEALEQLTFVNRLFYKVVDASTLIIVPDTPAKHKTYDDQFVRTFYLRNADDKESSQAIKTALTTIIGAGMKAHVDTQLGAITVLGTPDQLAVAEKIIAAHDKPRGEVLVEVKIIEVNRNKMRQYGIELTNFQVGSTFDPTGNSLSKDGLSTNVRAHMLSSLNLSDFILNIPSGIIAHFLETDTTARLVASPRLRAAEGKKASLGIVSQIPVPTTSFNTGVSDTTTPTSSGIPFATTSYQLKDVGLKLEIQPTIGSGDEITLEIKAEFGSEGAPRTIGNLLIPTFNTRTIDGQVRVKDGETSLIGGLLQEQESLTLKGILGLQNIPIIGGLLSNPTKTRTDTEMLISLTPHIVRSPHVSEADITPLDYGTQDRPRVRSAEPALFAAEAVAETSAKPREGPAVPAAVPTQAATPTPTPAAATQPLIEPLAAASPAPESAPAPVPVAPTPPEPVSADAILTASRTQLSRGESATVSLVVRRARALDGVEIDATFDPSAVQLVSVVPGGLLTLGGRAVTPSVTQLEPDRVHVRFSAQGASQAPGSGSGVVAVFTVRVIKEGVTGFRIESVRTLSGASGAGEVVPPPPALALTVVAAGNAPGGL